MATKRFFKFVSVFLLVFLWLFFSWPVIWQNPRIPPEMMIVEAAPCTTATMATGTDPAAATVAPGTAIADHGVFTILGNGTSCVGTVTALTVTLAGSGTPYQGLAEVRITDSAGSTTYFSAVTSFSSNSVSFSGGTAIPVGKASQGAVEFKIRVTPLTHANMPAVPGASYGIASYVSAWITTLIKSGSDTNPNTTTIDNLSPANVTFASGTAGFEKVVFNWTNPGDSDFHSSVVLRRVGSAVADTPVEGTTYIAGNTIGDSTVACVVATPTATCTDTGLVGGTVYHYLIFAKDSNVNYSQTGVVPGNSPFTPTAKIYSVTITSTANNPFDYGIVALSGTKSTVDLSKTQTAQNSGNVTENLNIKTSKATNGVEWAVGGTAGNNIFVHEYSVNGGGWTAFDDDINYKTLTTGVIVSGTVDFDLRITVPTDSDAQQKDITVTIQAIAPP